MTPKAALSHSESIDAGEEYRRGLASPAYRLSLVAAAEEYSALGWPMLPVGPDKRPAVTAWHCEELSAACKATLDIRKVQEWLARRLLSMIGVRTGAISRLLVIDIDSPKHATIDLKTGQTTQAATNPDGEAAFRAFCEEQAQGLPGTWIAKTPSGGWHIYFFVPEGWDYTPLKRITGFLPGVDILAARSFIIAPPSLRLDGAYKWVKKPGDRPALLPRWLYDILSQPRPRPQLPPPPAAEAKIEQPTTDGEGFTPYGRAAIDKGLSELRRAEQGERNNTLNRIGGGLFQLAAAGQIPMAVLEEALQREGEALGLDAQEVRRTIQSAKAFGVANPRYPGAEEPWEEPVPLEAVGLEGLPRISLADMPPILASFCETVAQSLEVPPELPFGLAMAVIATAVQPRFSLKVRRGFEQPLNLFILVPMESGERKSPALKMCAAPLLEWEANQLPGWKQAHREALSQRKTREKSIDALRNKIAKTDSEAEATRLQTRINQLETCLPTVPPRPRLMVDDITPEALAVALADHGECLGMLSAEGGFIDILGGLYSDRTPKLDLVLKAYAREFFAMDRRAKNKDGEAESFVLTAPCLTIGLSPQPYVLRTRKAGQAFRARGLDARFLYLFPPSRLGKRSPEPPPANSEAINAFKMRITSFLPLIAWGEPTHEPPKTLTLSQEASAVWAAYFTELEGKLAKDGELEQIKDWVSKFQGAVTRIAGIYHLVQHGPDAPLEIPKETMEQAVACGRVLEQHALAGYGIMSSVSNLEAAQAVLDWIKKSGLSQFTVRECFRGCRRKTLFPNSQAVKEALSTLEDRNFVRVSRRRNVNNVSMSVYLVNPLWDQAKT